MSSRSESHRHKENLHFNGANLREVPPAIPRRPANRFGDLELDGESIRVLGPKGVVELSLGEYRVFTRLAAAGGTCVAWGELAQAYGVDLATGKHAIELAIDRLRRKLRLRGSRVRLATAYGLGCRLVAPDAAER